MNDEDATIAFRDPRRRASAEASSKRREQERDNTVDPILQALNSAPRNRDWYPIFAQNLGEMARRLDPDKPLDAARRMFREAFGETADANWRKRKRYIRLEDEASNFDTYGDYVSKNDPFRLLSDAFAKLHFAGDGDGPRKAHRMLVRGTSLNPRPTIDASQTDGLSQVLEWMRDLQAKCAADPDIAAPLSCLNKFPIAPFGADELPDRLTERNLAASRRGAGLSVVPTATSTIAECSREAPLSCWNVGRVLLGYLYFPQSISSVALGLSADDFLAQLDAAIKSSCESKASEAHRQWKATNRESTSKELSEARRFERSNQTKAALDYLTELISERLAANSADNFWIGYECYDDEIIPPLLEHKIYIRKPVYLTLSPDGAHPKIKLEITGEWHNYYPDRRGDAFEMANPEVFTLGATPADDELIIDRDDLTTFNELRGVKVRFNSPEVDDMRDWGLQLVDSANETHVVGGSVLRKYRPPSYSAAVGDVEMRDALLEGAKQETSFFRPIAWDDLGRLSAAPHGSLAASILRNLAFAPEEKRIDALLIKNARERLRGIVEFANTELEKTNASLGARGVGIT